jgi:hypothetical protein
VSDFQQSENSGVPFTQLPGSVPARAEILLVLNDAESYHWSPSLRVGAVVHANRRHRDRCPHYC